MGFLQRLFRRRGVRTEPDTQRSLGSGIDPTAHGYSFVDWSDTPRTVTAGEAFPIEANIRCNRDPQCDETNMRMTLDGATIANDEWGLLKGTAGLDAGRVCCDNTRDDPEWMDYGDQFGTIIVHEPGTYTLEVRAVGGFTESRSLTVDPAPFDPNAVSVTGCPTPASGLESGSGAELTAPVENGNTQPATADLVFTVGSTEVARGSISLAAGESAEVTDTYRIADVGSVEGEFTAHTENATSA